MKVIHTPAAYLEWRRTITNSIGFVPTMGQLHEGHATLLRQSKRENSLSVLSIFVNPTQFNDPADLKNYPRDFDHDAQLAEDCGVDLIFYPEYSAIYPDHYAYQIHETLDSHRFEGEIRPGHFNGMLTVVMKLLNIVKATRAYFGEKDYQQFQLVRGLAEAFFLETSIIPVHIVRDRAGLALSSRHQRMTQEELAIAREFSKIFLHSQTPEQCTQALEVLGITVQYNEILNNRWYIAVKIGHTRLIDNKAC